MTRVRVRLYEVLCIVGLAVLAHPIAQVPRWAGSVSGGPGSIPGRFWHTGVPSFGRCSAEPLIILQSGSVKYCDVVRLRAVLFSQSSLSSAGQERASPRLLVFCRFARFTRFPCSRDHPEGLLAV